MGLEGESPESVDTLKIAQRVKDIYTNSSLSLNSHHTISFIPSKHLVFHFGVYLPSHPNGMRVSAYNTSGDLIATNEYYSIGGGFVVNEALKKNNVYFKDKRVDHVVELEKTNEVKEQAEIELKEVHMKESDALKKASKTTGVDAALPFHDAGIL